MGSSAISRGDISHLITKEFLQNVLEKEGKWDGEILSYKIAPGTKPGDNYMSIIYTIELQLKLRPNGELKTRSLFIKCYPNHPGRQKYANKSNMFYKEMSMYTKWIPELQMMIQRELVINDDEIQLPYAPFVHADCIDFESDEGKALINKILSPLDNYIILEDIRKCGFLMTNCREPLDLPHMRLVFSSLARIHALSWAYRQQVEPNITRKFDCMRPNLVEGDNQMWTKDSLTKAAEILDKMLYKGNRLSEATLRFRDEIVDKVAEFFMGQADGTVLEEALRVKIDKGEYHRPDNYDEVPWRVICHGDCWSNNMMFRYESSIPVEMILLDLQLPSEGCPTKDLQYVIYASTNGSLRRDHLTSLLALYHEEFTSNCELVGVKPLPGFTLEELQYRFQRGKLLGFFIASMALPIILKEQDKIQNLEEVDDNLENFFKGLNQNVDNRVYRTRILEITRELYQQNII